MGEMTKNVQDSRCISSRVLDLERSRAGRLSAGSLLPARSWTLVQIQAEAYMFTLFLLLSGSWIISKPWVSLPVNTRSW